jgi:hypothetical protein
VIDLDKIVEEWESLEQDASITDLVGAISRKYHIANDTHLFYAIKATMNANKHLFTRRPNPSTIVENELSKVVTYEKFEIAYSKFLEQADSNVESKKSVGSKTPYGFFFDANQNIICGGGFSQHFGQGAASKTPYMSWHVVSIYYVVESQKIVLGIEESRYPHLKDMEQIKTEPIGKKDRNVVVFYECSRNSIDYKNLYDKFMRVSQQVMELGLE